MRQAKKDQKAADAARKIEIKKAREEAERLALEEEALLTEGLDDLEKVLMRSTIRAKVSEQGDIYIYIQRQDIETENPHHVLVWTVGGRPSEGEIWWPHLSGCVGWGYR